jgi:UDP-arabinose 4-epimerase
VGALTFCARRKRGSSFWLLISLSLGVGLFAVARSSLNVLVTGGAGYIGSHTCKALSLAGYRPIAYDNLVHGHRDAVRWGPMVEADVADAARLKETLGAHSIGAVIHFAGYAYVGESMKAPGRYFKNNVSNALILLDAMVETGVRWLVFSSTCATYGVPQTTPIAEDHPQNPISAYGESKLAVERALRWYERAYSLKAVALRYFNAAGADPEGEAGESHNPETHLIPLAIATALGQRESLDIYGCDYATPDGTALRDYVHVSDLALGHVRALDYLRTENDSVVFNLGTGRAYSVREVAAAVERVSGRKLALHEQPRRGGDPAILVADAQRARQVLNWTPRYSDLDTIVETAWRWHREQARMQRALSS